MLSLIFDTETTGGMNYKKPYDDPEQPDIVQIAALLTNGTQVLGSMNLMVLPRKKCAEEAEKVHGITEDILQVAGMPPSVAIPLFNQFVKKADRLVAHNLAFDLDVVSRAYGLLGHSPEGLRSKPRVCTMKSSTKIVGLPPSPGRREPKWPKLQEAYKALVDINGFHGAHDAMIDVNACYRVLIALQEKRVELIA